MAESTYAIRGHGPHPFIRLLALFWLLGGVVLLLMGAGVWPDEAENWSRVDLWGLLAAGVASLLLGSGLMWGKLWAQPAAVLYHLWLALAALFLLFEGWPFEMLVTTLPTLLTPASWSGVLAFLLLGLAAFSLLVSYLFGQRNSWRHFASRRLSPLRNLCSCCGATQQAGGTCPYCDIDPERFYFLEPLVMGAMRTLLPFELGHWRIQIGRGVPWGNHARLQHEHYAKIGNHHANIEMDPQTDELRISPAGLQYEIAVNNCPVQMSMTVKSGDIIKLSDIEFVLGTSDDKPVLAYFYSVQDGYNIKHLLVFSAKQPERKIGRAKNNDVVFPYQWMGISNHHATIIYSPTKNTFHIYNESQQKETLRVDGDQIVEPEHNYELGMKKTALTFDQYDFWFLPISYEQGINGG